MKPKKDCETCGGSGKIQVEVITDRDFAPELMTEDCPECEAWNELIDEQIHGA